MTYTLYIAGLEYRFETASHVAEFVETLFTFCVNRRELYEFIVADTLEYVLEYSSEMSSRELAVPMLKALSILAQKYGPIYDPDQEIFKIVKDDNNLLHDITH